MQMNLFYTWKSRQLFSAFVGNYMGPLPLCSLTIYNQRLVSLRKLIICVMVLTVMDDGEQARNEI